MGVDLFQSRRDCNEFCRWWSRTDDEVRKQDNELVMKRIPSGTFWAKEISPEEYKKNIVAGDFIFDSSHTTIRSPDDCFGLKQDDLVEYQGETWIVVTVQKGKAKLSNTFFATDRNCSHYWYIELRK